MNFLYCVLFSMYMVLKLVSNSEAGTLPAGYEKVGWNSSVETVRINYPRGQISTLGDAIIYRQYKPVKMIIRRNFAFEKGLLHTVSVTFDEQYVVKQGIERLLQSFVKIYGDCLMDSSQAPHMVSCVWKDKDTKISFSYAPKRPDMTVIIFESVDKVAGAV